MASAECIIIFALSKSWETLNENILWQRPFILVFQFEYATSPISSYSEHFFPNQWHYLGRFWKLQEVTSSYMKEVILSGFFGVHYPCLFLVLLFPDLPCLPGFMMDWTLWNQKLKQASFLNFFGIDVWSPWWKKLTNIIGYYNIRQCVMLQSLCVKKWVQCLTLSSC